MKVEQRRRLTDLYAHGEELTLGKGDESYKVWVRRMTPADAEVAYLKANARRASIMAQAKEDNPGEFYIAVSNEVQSMDKDALVNWLTERELSERVPVIEARVAGSGAGEDEDGWGKDNYLGSLRERFNDEDFQERMVEIPDDAEVKRVLSELARFHNDVEEETRQETAVIHYDFDLDPEDELRHEVIKRILDTQSQQAWLQEFYNCQLWRCVFWADTRELVFQTRQEVDEVQAEVANELRAAVERVHVPDAEGKE